MGEAQRAEVLETIFSAQFPASEPAVAEQIDLLLRTLRDTGLSEELQSNAMIVLGEVLNNIVEHALADRPQDRIFLEIAQAGAQLSVETVDYGRPLPPSLLEGSKLPQMPTELDYLPEGGFGWFIIHSLAKDMLYEREAGANRLSFAFRD